MVISEKILSKEKNSIHEMSSISLILVIPSLTLYVLVFNYVM